jgi:hypothetical protein
MEAESAYFPTLNRYKGGKKAQNSQAIIQRVRGLNMSSGRHPSDYLRKDPSKYIRLSESPTKRSAILEEKSVDDVLI